jgi:hypothetical protein
MVILHRSFILYRYHAIETKCSHCIIFYNCSFIIVSVYFIKCIFSDNGISPTINITMSSVISVVSITWQLLVRRFFLLSVPYLVHDTPNYYLEHIYQLYLKHVRSSCMIGGSCQGRDLIGGVTSCLHFPIMDS